MLIPLGAPLFIQVIQKQPELLRNLARRTLFLHHFLMVGLEAVDDFYRVRYLSASTFAPCVEFFQIKFNLPEDILGMGNVEATACNIKPVSPPLFVIASGVVQRLPPKPVNQQPMQNLENEAGAFVFFDYSRVVSMRDFRKYLLRTNQFLLRCRRVGMFHCGRNTRRAGVQGLEKKLDTFGEVCVNIVDPSRLSQLHL